MTPSENPASAFFKTAQTETGELTVYLKGRMDISSAAATLEDLKVLIAERTPAALTVDLEKVAFLDDFGALILFEVKQHLAVHQGRMALANVRPKAAQILNLVKFDTLEACDPHRRKRSVNIFVRLGGKTLENVADLKMLVSFLGSLVLSFIHVCLHPKSLRFDDTLVCMRKTGVEALPIVALISFLLGLIMAFMSSIQLEQFGANIYVASLVALAMVSELGPIMTAIIVAGRTGSAFAAEIATMKISEEIDALFAMGFDTTRFLAIPRLIGAILVVPLLTLFADLFAIAGGLTIGVAMLDLTMSSYISQTLKTLTLFEVFWGLTKSVIFAVLIAWIGCLRGFQARGGASAVGNAATSAVVSSIFLIILFDSIFAVIRSYW